jgi:hypothetical protein
MHLNANMIRGLVGLASGVEGYRFGREQGQGHVRSALLGALIGGAAGRMGMARVAASMLNKSKTDPPQAMGADAPQNDASTAPSHARWNPLESMQQRMRQAFDRRYGDPPPEKPPASPPPLPMPQLAKIAARGLGAFVSSPGSPSNASNPVPPPLPGLKGITSLARLPGAIQTATSAAQSLGAASSGAAAAGASGGGGIGGIASGAAAAGASGGGGIGGIASGAAAAGASGGGGIGGIAALVGGVTALTAGIAGLAIATKLAADASEKNGRNYSPFSAQLNQSYGELDAGRLRRKASDAAAYSGGYSSSAKAKNRLEEAIAPFSQLIGKAFEPVTTGIFTKAYDMAASVLETASKAVKIEKEKPKKSQQVKLINDLSHGVFQPKRKPLRKI